jgi:hypothetical protein
MGNCKLDTKLKPGTHCALCGKSYKETGGHRILGQQARGVGFSDRPIGGGNSKNRNICIPLEGNDGLFIVFSGPDGFWTDESMQRAIRMYHKNEHPYLCSSCAMRTCSKCGAPLRRPVGSTYHTDDGAMPHAPILGGKVGCQNPDCENFQ